MRPRGRSDALRAAGAAISRLRIFLTVHAVTEAAFLLPLIYTSWALAMLSDDPGLIATYLVLVGGIEHTAVSCMVLISLCFVLCPCCRDVDSALKAYAAFCIIAASFSDLFALEHRLAAPPRCPRMLHRLPLCSGQGPLSPWRSTGRGGYGGSR